MLKRNIGNTEGMSFLFLLIPTYPICADIKTGDAIDEIQNRETPCLDELE